MLRCYSPCRADRATLRPAWIKIASGVTTGELALWMDDDANAVGLLAGQQPACMTDNSRMKRLATVHAQESCGFVGLPTDVILDSVRYGGVISMACHVSQKALLHALKMHALKERTCAMTMSAPWHHA
jgi:hypothetical protein